MRRLAAHSLITMTKVILQMHNQTKQRALRVILFSAKKLLLKRTRMLPQLDLRSFIF